MNTDLLTIAEHRLLKNSIRRSRRSRKGLRRIRKQGCDAVESVEDKQTCDNCGQDHKYCEPINKEQFGFCGNWAEHQ